MPIKDAIAKTWALVPSADGRLWSRYPDGDALAQDYIDDYYAEDYMGLGGPQGVPLAGAATGGGAAAGALAAGASQALAGAATGGATAGGDAAHAVPLAGAAGGAGSAAGSLPGVALTSFTVQSAGAAGTYPFVTAFTLPQGAATSISTNLANCQVSVLRSWPDGSIDHAQVAGRCAMTSAPTTVTVIAGAPPSGINITLADIQAAAPSASAQFGAFGTVNLSALLATPQEAWVLGHEMSEGIYRSDIGSTELAVEFHVKRFADGRMLVAVVGENGYLDNGSGGVNTGVTRTYVPTVIVGGVTLTSGASITHYKGQRWRVEGWIGGDPQVQPLHNVADLRATGKVPNYRPITPSAGTLDGLVQSVGLLDRGPHEQDMSVGGAQLGIGMLPNWDALYFSCGDVRAYKALIAGAVAINAYPICWRSKTSKQVIKPSDFATWTPDGPGAGGVTNVGAGSNIWEIAHHPSAGTSAYMLTGDKYHYDTMMMQAAACYLFKASGTGNGTSRLIRGQTRGIAWSLRSIGQAAAFARNSHIGAGALYEDYRTLLANNYAAMKAEIQAAPSSAWMGFAYQYQLGSWTGTGSIAPWMSDYLTMVNAYVSEMQPVADMTALIWVRDWMYRFIVSRLGISGDAAHFDFTRAGQYGINVAVDDVGSAYHQSMGKVHEATFGSLNTTATNTLTGTSASDPANAAQGYWGYLLPAICYAVDHRFPGARAAYNRLTGATNWATMLASFAETPVFGCAPRLAAFAPSYSVPSTVNTSTLIGTNTARSVKPSAWTDGEFDLATFHPFGGMVFAPTYGRGGAVVMDNPGGHNNLYFPGSLIFELQNATWSRLDNANGVPMLSANSNYEVADTNGSPYYELNSATSGQFRAAGHNYANQVAINEGSKGAVLSVGRGAVCFESVNSPTVHKTDLATGLVTRYATGSLANFGLEGSSCHDPNTDRIYATGTQFWDNTAVAYLRLSDKTFQTLALSGFPPSGSNYTKMHVIRARRVLLIIDNAGALFGLDTTATPGTANWTVLTTSGSWSANSGTNPFVEHPSNGKYYRKSSSTGNVIDVLTPPQTSAVGHAGTWVKSSVTIGGSGLPNRTESQEAYACLHPCEDLNALLWVAGTTQQVAVSKV